jgi:hypothetical protein
VEYFSQLERRPVGPLWNPVSGGATLSFEDRGLRDSMANQHRRVEPRSIIGTGMATDPDRIRDIEHRAERMQRDHALPKRKFGEVIAAAGVTPPPGTELDDAPPQRDLRGHKPPPSAASRASAQPPPPEPAAQEPRTPAANPEKDAADPDPKSAPRSPAGARTAEQSRSMGGNRPVSLKG